MDPTSGEVQPITLDGQASGVAFTPDGVWVSVAPAAVARVDPAGLTVTLRQGVGSGPTAVLPAFGSIWVANHLDDTVFRLEPSTGRVEGTIEVGEGPNALGAAAGSLWVANEFDDSITSIDPAANAVEQIVPVGGAAASLTAEGDGLWLAVGASVAEHRGGTLTVSSAVEAPTSLDPAVVGFNDTIGGQILSITNDGLLSFKKVGGAEGATLVPDLASALPEVSADGTVVPVPAAVGDPLLDRGTRAPRGLPPRPGATLLAGRRTWPRLFSAIEGAKACSEDPSTCDLSGSIVVNAEAITFLLSRPDPDLPLQARAARRPSRSRPPRRPRTRAWSPSRRRGRT